MCIYHTHVAVYAALYIATSTHHDSCRDVDDPNTAWGRGSERDLHASALSFHVILIMNDEDQDKENVETALEASDVKGTVERTLNKGSRAIRTEQRTSSMKSWS